MDHLLLSTRIWLIFCGACHMVLFFICILGLYYINFPSGDNLLHPRVNSEFWKNGSLLGATGSALYFSRKAYVYLITDRVVSLQRRATEEIDSRAEGREKFVIRSTENRIYGYIMYLTLRPFGGFVIGPLVSMIILAGINTFGSSNVSNAGDISSRGIYLIYVFSFIGGYTSSDMFDYFSRLGSRFSRNTSAANSGVRDTKVSAASRDIDNSDKPDQQTI